MPANRARGEVVVVLTGRERRLCLTLGALAELETAFAAEGWRPWPSGCADCRPAI